MRTSMQSPQVMRPQQSSRWSGSEMGFSVFSSYWGDRVEKSVAQVQQASFAIFSGD